MGVNQPLHRKLNMALVGGGQGAFIGRVHATAAVLDNRARLVAGALSSNPERAKASAADYDIGADRAYGSYQEMLEKEATLPEGQRIDFLSVATPNHTHFEIAKAGVEAGFNVICDKPMTFDLSQAEQLLTAVEKSGVVFAVSHNYTGYPLVRQAREMILGGDWARFKPFALSIFKAGCEPSWKIKRRNRRPGEPIPPRAEPLERSAISPPTPTIWDAS